MRPRPRRELSAFSMSLLDVIAGALGMFIILVVVLVVQVRKTEAVATHSSGINARLKKQLSDLQATQASTTADSTVKQSSLQKQLAALKAENGRFKRDKQGLERDLQYCRQDLEVARKNKGPGRLPNKYRIWEIDGQVVLTDKKRAETGYRIRYRCRPRDGWVNRDGDGKPLGEGGGVNE